jgi:hypothetical protein
MHRTKKIWLIDKEPQPEGDKVSCFDNSDKVPKGWFKEAPAYAAELFALEHHGSAESSKEYKIRVIDEADQIYDFVVRCRRETTASVYDKKGKFVSGGTD